jgi:hypothetical protein
MKDYSLQPIILFVNIDVSKYILVLPPIGNKCRQLCTNLVQSLYYVSDSYFRSEGIVDTSILAKSIMGWREYCFFIDGNNCIYMVWKLPTADLLQYFFRNFQIQKFKGPKDQDHKN